MQTELQIIIRSTGFFNIKEMAADARSAQCIMKNTGSLRSSNIASLVMTHADDTLIIATADHSHVFTVGGYPKRGNPIFGVVMNIYENKPELGSDGKPYTTLGYANGPGGINGTRENLTGVVTGDKDYRQQATVIRYKETHGLEDVGKF